MKKVVIAGAGFAGLACVDKLRGSGLEVTVIDRKPDMDFLPLLPDCIGRRINPEFLAADIAAFCVKSGAAFVLGEVSSADLRKKVVYTGDKEYPYDCLLISSGSQTNFFSDLNAREYAFPLNNLRDLRRIGGMLKAGAFDSLIICGAGYTGIEAATNLRVYFKKKKLEKRVVLVERAPSILGPLPAWMRDYTVKNLRNLGIEVLVNSVIEAVREDEVAVSGGKIFKPARLLWVPGVRTADFIQKLELPKNPQGRIIVDEYLRAGEACFCAGDTAFFSHGGGGPLRMAVQFSLTQGSLAAENILRSLKNLPLKKYRPYDLGYIIPMANNRSCGRVMGLKVSGLPATFLHLLMCIFRSFGWRNRFGLALNLLKGGEEW